MMMCIQNLVGFCQCVLKILSGNEILTSIKGRNSVKILQKMTGNNPKLGLVNVDVCTKFGLILSSRSQNIEHKRNVHRKTELRKDRVNPALEKWGYKNDFGGWEQDFEQGRVGMRI